MSKKSYFKSYNNLTTEQLLIMWFMPNNSNKSLQSHSLQGNKARKTVIKPDNYCSFIFLYSRTMSKLSEQNYLVRISLLQSNLLFKKPTHSRREIQQLPVTQQQKKRQICQSDLLIWLVSLSQPLTILIHSMTSCISNAFMQIENWSKDLLSQNLKPEENRVYRFIFSFWHSALCTIFGKLTSLLVIW